MRREERVLVEELGQRPPQVLGVDHRDEDRPLVADLVHAADPAPAGLRPALAETGEALAQRAGGLDGLRRQPDGREHGDQPGDRLHLHGSLSPEGYTSRS